MTSWDDPEFRAAEQSIRRRRLIASVVTLVAFAAVAGASAVGAVAGAHDDRADASSVHQVAVDTHA